MTDIRQNPARRSSDLAGLLPLQLQFSEDFALNVAPRSGLHPFGIKFALNSRAVREDSMTEATSRAGMKRAVPGREAVPITTIGKIEADGVQVFLSSGWRPERTRSSLAARIPNFIVHVPGTHSTPGQ